MKGRLYARERQPVIFSFLGLRVSTMTRQVLFVQGAGQGAHEADAKLAASLARELGPDYEIRYPAMPDEDAPEYAAWGPCLAQELAAMGEGPLLVGHSAGATMLLIFLASGTPQPVPAGIFLIAPPFCGEGGWDCGDFNFPKDLNAKLPPGVPLFLYHGREDETVPFAHMDLYARVLPEAALRVLEGRDHQLNDDLSDVARDIRQLV
jgi:predicted alpha/beta hydrolase family esterase